MYKVKDEKQAAWYLQAPEKHDLWFHVLNFLMLALLFAFNLHRTAIQMGEKNKRTILNKSNNVMFN